MTAESPLNPRQELFCTFVANGATYASAARMAGYAPKSSRERGSELMAHAVVRDRVLELMRRRAAEHGSMFERLEGWLVHLVERSVETDQIGHALRAIDRLMHLHGMNGKGNGRLPAFQIEEADTPASLLADAPMATSMAAPMAALASLAADAAPPALNRRQRRALEAELRRK